MPNKFNFPFIKVKDAMYLVERRMPMFEFRDTNINAEIRYLTWKASFIKKRIK